MSTVKYKTAPVKVWGKAKELRDKCYEEIATAREKGLVRVSGSVHSFRTLVSGLGPYCHLGGEPYGASIATDKVFQEKCAEEMENRGYARDLCSYMRNYWGSMFLDQYFFGRGPFPKPDFVLQTHCCESQGKWYQLVAEFEGVPAFTVDWPVTPTGGREEAKDKYVADQLLDAIEWMEKVTGRKYNDELFIHHLKNEFLSTSLWGEICLLNQAIPAPLDQKSMISLHVNSILMRERDEAVAFFKELRDEVKERVANKIAAVPTERYRIIYEGMPIWFFLDLFRYLEKYGVAAVMSIYTLFLAGTVDELPDGTFVRRKTPMEQGWPLKTREDAVLAFAKWTRFKNYWFPLIGSLAQDNKTSVQVRMAQQWHVNAVIMHMNRGCEAVANGEKEQRLALMEAGFPVVAFEGNAGDRRETDEAQIIKRVDTFFESQGLQPLTA